MAAKKNKKLSELTPAELASAADELEREAKDRSRWRETETSRARRAERESWIEGSSYLVSIRFPKRMLRVLRALAAAEGIGYQTFIKQILHREIMRRAQQHRVHADEIVDKLHRDQDEAQIAVAALAGSRRR